MNHMLMGILVIAGIMTVAAFATSSISDISNTSTQSNQIDIEKKSESMNIEINGTTLSITNTGKYASEIAMLRFYDSTGDEVKRVVTDNNSGTHIDDSKRHVLVGELSDNLTLDPHKLREVQLHDLGLNSVDGLTGEIVTMRGRTFPIEFSDDTSDIDEIKKQIDFLSSKMKNGTGDGQSMIDGMGINSRIIQMEYDGRITHGTGVQGKDESIRPYLSVNSNSDFAAVVLNTDNYDIFKIPEFWHEYNYDNSGLTDITTEPLNILGYLETRNVVGSNTISINDGIVVSGSGTSIIKLNNYESNRIILTGIIESGNVKLITPASIDFMSAPYGSHGFAIPASVPAIVGLGETHYGTAEWDAGYTQISSVCVYDLNPHAVKYYTPVTSHSIVPTTFTTSDMSDHTQITSIGGYSIPSVPTDTGEYYHYYRCGNSMYSGIKEGWTSGVTLKLYDTLPAYTILHYSKSFVNDFTFPSEQTYLYVKPNGGTVTIKGQAVTGTPELKINNLEPNIPYQITKDGLIIATGMTSPGGTIIVDSDDITPKTGGGFLKLYPDSLSYRGSFSTVIFDNLHNQTIHIPTVLDRTYVVHAYASIPVTGNVTITNVNLDGTLGTLPLSYLNKDYTSGDYIQVPVIPGYFTINLEINGIKSSLRYGDILGNTGISIAEPSTNTIKTSSNSPISSAESISGTTAYAVATSKGNLKAIISETISGHIKITNTYHLEKIPPLPPQPRNMDPLHGYVDVFINGDKYGDTIHLGKNENPKFTPVASVSGLVATKSVTYSYPDYTLSGVTSVPVNPGDFVEFFVYGKIHGDIDGYSAPPGYNVSSSSGVSTATVTIRSAHIQTSQ